MEKKLIELYEQLQKSGAYFFEFDFSPGSPDKKSAVIAEDDEFAVFLDPARVESTAEEIELIAHECGHVETGTTHSVCSPTDLIAKHEFKANKWAVHKILPEHEIRQAINDGCYELWEIAEYVDRTEQFVRMALNMYRLEGINFSSELADDLVPIRI